METEYSKLWIVIIILQVSAYVYKYRSNMVNENDVAGSCKQVESHTKTNMKGGTAAKAYALFQSFNRRQWIQYFCIGIRKLMSQKQMQNTV
jgi:hypothetical protein